MTLETRLRCSLCGHEDERPWTQVVLGERCPRCATGRLIQADVRLTTAEDPRELDASPAQAQGGG